VHSLHLGPACRVLVLSSVRDSKSDGDVHMPVWFQLKGTETSPGYQQA
jgi:hypothetical protein